LEPNGLGSPTPKPGLPVHMVGGRIWSLLTRGVENEGDSHYIVENKREQLETPTISIKAKLVMMR